jgi:hypothetical protein
MSKDKHKKVHKRAIVLKLCCLFIFALIASFLTLYLLTPSIREISFQYSGCVSPPADYDIKNHIIEVSLICSQKNSDERRLTNLRVIEYKDDISQRLASLHIPFIDSIRFKFAIINKSTARVYSNIDPSRFVEKNARLICEENGKKKVIIYGEQLPYYSLKAEFLRLSELKNYYTTLEKEIFEHCSLVGDTINYKIQIRSSTSTPILDDTFWVGTAGETMTLKSTLSESYKVWLRPDFVNYLILVPMYFFGLGLSIKKFREDMKLLIK